jgi:hypothetical protein
MKRDMPWDPLSFALVALSVAAFKWISAPAGFAILASYAAISAVRARDNRRLGWAWVTAALLLAADAVIAATASSFWATLPLAALTLTILFALALDASDLRVSASERNHFYIWWGATTGVVVAGAIVAVVHARQHLRDDAPSEVWPTSRWVLIPCITALAVSAIGGFLVFRRKTSWQAVLIWPLSAGFAISLSAFAVPYLMGETEHGGVVGSCIRNGHQLCGQFGVVEPYFVIISPIVIPAVFIAAHILRRYTRELEIDSQ